MQAAAFAPDVVECIEAGKPDLAAAEERFKRYGYTGGLADCVVEWIPKGTRFDIDDYDGSETLRIYGPTVGLQA